MTRASGAERFARVSYSDVTTVRRAVGAGAVLFLEFLRLAAVGKAGRPFAGRGLVTWELIAHEYGESVASVKRWASRLRCARLLEVDGRQGHGVRLRLLNAYPDAGPMIRERHGDGPNLEPRQKAGAAARSTPSRPTARLNREPSQGASVSRRKVQKRAEPITRVLGSDVVEPRTEPPTNQDPAAGLVFELPQPEPQPRQEGPQSFWGDLAPELDPIPERTDQARRQALERALRAASPTGRAWAPAFESRVLGDYLDPRLPESAFRVAGEAWWRDKRVDVFLEAAWRESGIAPEPWLETMRRIGARQERSYQAQQRAVEAQHQANLTAIAREAAVAAERAAKLRAAWGGLDLSPTALDALERLVPHEADSLRAALAAVRRDYGDGAAALVLVETAKTIRDTRDSERPVKTPGRLLVWRARQLAGRQESERLEAAAAMRQESARLEAGPAMRRLEAGGVAV